MKEKENEFIILEQPGKSILSIILVDGDFPMSEESHAGIERLREVSDIFFIIPELKMPSFRHNVIHRFEAPLTSEYSPGLFLFRFFFFNSI